MSGNIELEEKETDENAMAEGMSRKEKRNLLKKMKRKQLRRETAIKERAIEEAVLNDPESQMKLLRLEREEAERMERDRREFEERERQFVLALELKKRQQEAEAEAEEEERRKRDEDESNRDLVNNGDEDELKEDDDWEYVEEGPAEIIWKGNEIIVKKKKVKVPKKVPGLRKEESERPISNPLAPQSEAFEDYRSAQDVLESVAQQVPNFGTEQDKAHCPFHLKTGVCRFGARCSRVHFYPDKSCTLLIKSMYSGPGLAWEQDEGLEYTDEEVERSFEEFYEDVHTEFLKFGEIVNFKVCKNASSHLRGNVYVHYKLLESAVLAYQSINGRYFAGKQLSCEFINLTKWKVAICGEYMKSRLQTCSRGSVCNFIHCFRNPGGDYEWADWGKPAPRYWLQEMDALFGDTGDRIRDESPRYASSHLKRSRSRAPDTAHRRSHFDEGDDHRSRSVQRHRGESKETTSSPENRRIKFRKTDSMLSYRSKRSRSRAPDSPSRNSHFGDDDDHRSSNLQHHKGESSSPENRRIKRRKTDGVGKSNCSSGKQKSGHRNSYSNRESDPRLARQASVNNAHVANVTDNDLGKREGGDRPLERKSRTSSRWKSDSKSGHEQHSSSDKINQFDTGKSPRMDRHLSKSRRYESEDSLQNKKEAYTSDIDSDGDNLSRGKNWRHGYESMHMKDDAYMSNNSSNESGYGRDGTYREDRKNISTSKNKSDLLEFKKSDSSERKDVKYHSHSANSSRVMENISESVDEGKVATDGKKPQRCSRGKSKRPENKSDFTDSEGERCQHRTDARRSRNAKNCRQVKHDAESSDNAFGEGRPRRYGKKSRKDRISGSESKNDLDFINVQSNLRRLNREVRHDEYGKTNNMLHIEEGSSKVDCDAYRPPLDCERPEDKNQKDVSNSGPDHRITDAASHRILAETHGTCFDDLESTRDQTSYDMDKEYMLPTKECNEETTTSQMVKACFRDTGCHNLGGQSDAELEQTYRMAALKKLEEMRKSKDMQSVQSRNLNIDAELHGDVEGSKDLEEISGSREVGTSAAATARRRRI